MQLTEFFAMSGYGIYVWPAYFITLLIFGINLFSALKENYQIKKLIIQSLMQTPMKKYAPDDYPMSSTNQREII